MKICVIIGEKKLIGTDTRSWTTSHFTWGEGTQYTDHYETTYHYLTEISVYVDDLQNYLDMNGLTSDADFSEVPTIYSLGKLTGLTIQLNQPYPTFSPMAGGLRIIPCLETGWFAYIGTEGTNDRQRSFIYRKIELTQSCDNMALVRKIKAYTHESEESSYR